LCNPVIKMIRFFVSTCNGAPVEWNWQGRTEVLGGKTCPTSTLPTTNPTWSDLGSNPGLRGERPATNRLSHGTVRGRPLLTCCNYIRSTKVTILNYVRRLTWPYPQLHNFWAERGRQNYSDGTQMSQVVPDIEWWLCSCNVFDNFLRLKRKVTGKGLSKWILTLLNGWKFPVSALLRPGCSYSPLHHSRTKSRKRFIPA
jgi:hypothetical protein